MSIFSGKCDFADIIGDKSLHGLLDWGRRYDIFEYTRAHVTRENAEEYAKALPDLPSLGLSLRVEKGKRGGVSKAFGRFGDEGEEFPIDLTGKGKGRLAIIRRVNAKAPSEIVRRLRRIVAVGAYDSAEDGRRGTMLLSAEDYTERHDLDILSVFLEGSRMRPYEERSFQRYLWSILPWTLAYEQAPSSTLRFSQEVGVSGMQVLTFENPATGKCFDIQAMMEFDDPDDSALFDTLLHDGGMEGRGLEEVSAFLGSMGDDGRILFEPENGKEIAKNGLRFKKDHGHGGDEE